MNKGTMYITQSDSIQINKNDNFLQWKWPYPGFHIVSSPGGWFYK